MSWGGRGKRQDPGRLRMRQSQKHCLGGRGGGGSQRTSPGRSKYLGTSRAGSGQWLWL